MKKKGLLLLYFLMGLFGLSVSLLVLGGAYIVAEEDPHLFSGRNIIEIFIFGIIFTISISMLLDITKVRILTHKNDYTNERR